jgi:beta-galactosidase
MTRVPGFLPGDLSSFQELAQLMKHLPATFALSFILSAVVPASPPSQIRERLSFDSDWTFTKDDAPGTNVDRDKLVEALLPTSNSFLHKSPKQDSETNPEFGAGLPYVQPSFDDRTWQHLDLPHDWAIAGPFTHEGGGGMGRLPTAGAGWYRKSFMTPASDAHRSVFPPKRTCYEEPAAPDRNSRLLEIS